RFDPEGIGPDWYFYGRYQKVNLDESEKATLYNNYFPSMIGETTVSGSGEASTQWNSLTCGQTYKWRVRVNDGSNEVLSDTWSFEVICNHPPKIISTNIVNSSSRHGFTVNYIVYDPDGESDITNCRVKATANSESKTYTPSVDEAAGNSTEAKCSTSLIDYLDKGAWNPLSTLQLDLYAEDSDNTEDHIQTKNTFPNNKPSVSDLNFNDYTSKHAFNVSVEIIDTDNGQGELDKCIFKFDDDSDSTYQFTRTRTIDQGFGGTDEGKCVYSNINNSINNFKVNEEIYMRIKLLDIHNGEKVVTRSYKIPNQLPEINLINPKDGERVESDIATLKISVSD
ncbi:MAG: hypothetical protein ABEI78_00105, partial [Candidatus Nanohaloarchaea archaeon]